MSCVEISSERRRASAQQGADENDGSLKSLFYRGFRIYTCRFRENNEDDAFSYSCLTAKDQKVTLSELHQLFYRIAFFVERLSLFSPNEELDDINTCDLVFLLVPFILAELSSHGDVREYRKKFLESSLIHWGQFLHVMERLGLCSQLHLKRLHQNTNLSINPSINREEKIAFYTEHKELEREIQSLIHKKQKFGFDPFIWGANEVDDEEERRLIIAILKRSINEALGHISLVEQELELLSTDRSVLLEERSTEKPKKPFIMTIRDPSVMRKNYLDKVFQPFHELPTVTLADVAAWEMEIEVNKLGADERRRIAEKKKKRHEEIDVADEDTQQDDVTSDEDGFDDEKETKNRSWDDWKDDNPKGIGNKNRNIG